MGTPEDFVGRRFGRLIGIRFCGSDNGLRRWLWRCDCGKEIERPSAAIKQGRQVSCGCHRDELSRARAIHGKSGTVTYKAWVSMKSRCAGTFGKTSKHYFGRGIKVCRRWSRFKNFLADMGECPNNKGIERIDNNGDYRPGNCRWATQQEQMRNTRRTIRVTYGGREVCLKDACAMSGINYDCVRSRIRSGKPAQIALDMG